jgi:uncharacterized RDD family membrane protein YckC
MIAASAGFGRRFAALVYDAVLLAALLVVFTAGALIFSHGKAIVPETAGVWAYVYRMGLIAVVGGYFEINWIMSGQTLGMRAWRLRTVSDTGQSLGAGSALLRLILAPLAWLPAALGILWLYLDPDHVALHDRLSNTRVVELTRS